MPRRATPAPIRAQARVLRAATDGAAARLWGGLRPWRRTGFARFRRQAPIGLAIVDFADHGHRLVIEVVDPGQPRPDTGARDAWLVGQGYRILHVRSDEIVGNMDQVLAHIRAAVLATPPIPAATPTPNPSPQGGGEQAANGEPTPPQ